MAKYYEIYVAKYRNIEYLESELAAHRLREEEQRQEQAARVKKMRERLLKEELELLRSGGDLKAKDRDGVSDDDDDRKKQNSRGKGVLNRDRPRADLSDEDSLRGTQAAQRSSSPTRPIQRRVQHPIEDSDEDFGSSDDDDDDDGDDEVSDDNSDDNF